ncbi:hypothetical protein [Streptomyces alanosinicus]|uniref:Uncharacterized protein n=1 Tax=Streptomyces alanosinicus TaxID=68171 RepID=A0A918YMH6_9ACTN|nr:hypothetical protein [Streptomyces alanosinicus]GHE09718.1 hypothetical protein GCM10010339_63070 [Streptomyces alanosinicus]
MTRFGTTEQEQALTLTQVTGPGALVDAPAVHFERLSDRQREGRSCRWCSGTPDRRFPVPILCLSRARLYACAPCADMYGVPAAGADT